MMVTSTTPSFVLCILCLNAVSIFIVDSLSLESCGSSQCYNGEYEVNNVSNEDSGSCQCYPGWHGDSCQYCGGKMRLNTTYGSITEGPCDYESNAQCLWYLDTPSLNSTVHLLIHSLSLECSWDYLHVFSGDSLYSQKVAAFTGVVLEGEVIDDVNNTENYTTEIEERLELPIKYISLHVIGPTLLYFYSDVSKKAQGFYIEYWLDCPGNCSDHGMCDDDGSCDCDDGWTGELCDQEVCPSNCSGNGECDLQLGECICIDFYTGPDCSEKTPFILWDRHNISSSDGQWGSGSHSNVQWNGSVWLLGGYTFPEENPANDSVALLWRYGLDEETLELIEPQELWPSMRYGHSAVVYEDTMIVFGGVLVPSERFTAELWTYNFLDDTWDVQNPSTLPISYNNTNITSPYNTSSDDTTTLDYDDDLDGYNVLKEGVVNSSNGSGLLPLAVRGHTAHVIGDKMLVFFGVVRASNSQPSLIQQLDLENMTWSVPPQKGEIPKGRHEHTSVYVEEVGVVYVYGGRKENNAQDNLMAFNVTTYTWYKLLASSQQLLFHSTVFLDHLMVVFGGSQLGDDRLCFSNEILTYDTVCRRWATFELSGSPLGVGRRGHSAVAVNGESAMLVFGGYDGQLLSDVVEIQFSNCTLVTNNISQCVLGSVGKCSWYAPTNSCVEVSTLSPDQLELHCMTVVCLLRGTYNECVANDDDGDDMKCQWEFGYCVPFTPQPSSNSSTTNSTTNSVNGTLNNTDVANNTVVEVITEEDDKVCSHLSRLTGCDVCLSAGCSYVNGVCVSGPSNESMTIEQCMEGIMLCYDHTSCGSCVSDNHCLWCSSLQRCVESSLYPHLYPYGQCLGWQSDDSGGSNSCPQIIDCQSNSYSKCQSDIYCGWCYSPEMTGVGACTQGGFSGPRDLCPAPDWTWFYDKAPLCNCNGHSTCENDSVCSNCSDNTTGDHCEYCALGYTGDPINGELCEECECNGFGNACHNQTGVCYCDDYGVAGDHCTNCTVGASGNVDDYCFYKLEIGYSYTISIENQFIRKGSFVTFPETGDDLQFELEILYGHGLDLSIFGGRASQGLYRLENLQNVTGPNRVYGKVKYAIKDDDFGDDDLGLLIYVDNMYPPVGFKITLKQTNYLFLLYFFAAFCTCFLSLLLCFLLIWYVRKKLAYRRFVRAHYRELRQRISRPFTKMNVLVSTKPSLEKQRASCIGVEPCGDGKAAVLSLLVQLPGESTSTNKPRHGQSGLCVGSALVKSSRSASEIKQRTHNSTHRNTHRNRNVT